MTTRARCEQCDTLQPPDWQPGDLCVACGLAVRREQRCAWCTRFTPAGQFCRHCGSGLVSEELYGAARMLKAAGVDQLSLPERLTSLPPAHLEHYSRLYAPQARMVERHVDDLSLAAEALDLSRVTRQAWGQALEHALLPLLPMPEEQRQALTLPPLSAPNLLQQLAEIRDGTPFAFTSMVAALASIQQGAPRNSADAQRASQALHADDPSLQTAAALTLANWRFTAIHSYAAQPGELRDALLTLYQRTSVLNPQHSQAGLGLALLARQYANVQSVPISQELLVPLLDSENPDLSFGAALVLGHAERLREALRVPERRFAAALQLARQSDTAPLAQVLPLLETSEQESLLGLMRSRKVPVPELRSFLLSALNVRELHKDAAHLLLLERRPEDARRLIEAEPALANELLRQPSLSVQEIEQIYAQIITLGQSRVLPAGRLSELVAPGQLSERFVIDLFMDANNDMQAELLNVARLQLETHGYQRLHEFLWTLLEGMPAQPIRERLWGVLSGWYGQYGAPLTLSVQGAQHFFGNVDALAQRICQVIEQPELLDRLFTTFSFLNIMEHPDPQITPALRASPVAARLRRALLHLGRDQEAYAPYRASAVRLLGQLAVSTEEQTQLAANLRPLLHPDAPWQLQRGVLAVLYPTEEAQAIQLAEWKAQRDAATDYATRAPLDNLIWQLERAAERN